MMEMYEIQNVAQEPGSRKRWFSSTDIQLYVYYRGDSAEIAGFELDFADYDFFIRYQGGSLKVFGVDHMRLASDLLTDTNRKITANLVRMFKEASAGLEPQVVSYVLPVLAEGLGTKG